MKYIWTLGEFQDNSTVEILSILSKSEDNSVKLIAYASLAKTQTEESINTLLENYTRETEEMNKMYVSQCLMKIDKEKLVPLLISSVYSPGY